MTLLHNLGGEKTFRCKDCAYAVAVTKDNEKRIHCRMLKGK